MKPDHYLSRIDKIMLVVIVAVFALGLFLIDATAQSVTPIDAGVSVADAALVDAPAAPAPSVVPSPVVSVEADLVGALKALVSSAREGNWKLVTALLLALAMAALNRVRGKIKWFAGDRGGAILVMVLGFAGGLSTALAAGMDVDLKLLWGAFSTSLLAAGGYNWFKRVVWPEDQGKKPPEFLDSAPPAAPEADVPVASPSEVA